MLLAETVRQCAIYLAHVRYAVPLHYKFTMQSMVIDADLDLLTIGACAPEVAINAHVTKIARSERSLSAFTVMLEFQLNDKVIGRGAASARVFPPDKYDHVRWQGAVARTPTRPCLPTPVDPDSVCVTDTASVVLGTNSAASEEGSWLLRADVTHPILFDHPLDHIPGVLVLEAARQSARLTLGESCADFEGLEFRFRRFIELDQPTTVTAQIVDAERRCVAVDFAQWGEIMATGTIRLAKHRDPLHHRRGLADSPTTGQLPSAYRDSFGEQTPRGINARV
jgi:hypothetical protein